MGYFNPDLTQPIFQPIPMAEQKPIPSKREKDSISNIKDQALTTESAIIQSELKSVVTRQKSTQTEWHTLQLTDNQLDEFNTIIKDTILPLINDNRMPPEDQFFSIDNLDTQKISKSLHPTEIAAIKFYTNDGFRLMNGSFDYDQSIKEFMTRRYIPETEFENVKRAGKMFALIATSGLNKLPAATASEVYRGDAISKERWDKMLPGSKIVMNRFTSTSKFEGTANTFLMTNASTTGGLGVIYVIMNPKQAKNIQMMSGVTYGKEAETIYAPHQTFEVVKTMIEEEPDLTDITGDDDEIKKAEKNGSLIKMENAKGKLKSYVQTGIQTTYKIYLKEME